SLSLPVVTQIRIQLEELVVETFLQGLMKSQLASSSLLYRQVVVRSMQLSAAHSITALPKPPHKPSNSSARDSHASPLTPSPEQPKGREAQGVCCTLKFLNVYPRCPLFAISRILYPSRFSCRPNAQSKERRRFGTSGGIQNANTVMSND